MQLFCFLAVLCQFCAKRPGFNGTATGPV